MMQKEYNNEDFIKDFYYIFHSNWYETGYFITWSFGRKAYVNYGVWFKGPNSNWEHDFNCIKLNKDEFYKTNTIFKEGLFNKE